MHETLRMTKAPRNEPLESAVRGTPAHRALLDALDAQRGVVVDIPTLVGGEERRGGRLVEVKAPHATEVVIGRYHSATSDDVAAAVEAALGAKASWASLPQASRAALFQRAAALLAGPYRAKLVAATMLGQSKTLRQAELDIVELVDFWRFNPYFAERLAADQPLSPDPGARNELVLRPLEGFVLAVTPFNFTAIGGNLPTAPALMGNVVLWKPARTAVVSSWLVMQVLREAGLPDGVINFLPGPGAVVGEVAMAHPSFAGLHFTGSTETFDGMWQTVGEHLRERRYRTYPRLVGETGGKDFVVAAPDADADALAVALFAGAFEYQGQKCSAASRAYVPRSLWPRVEEHLAALVAEARVGDPTEPGTFMGALIDEAAFERVVGYLELARSAPDVEVRFGGTASSERGWFVDPTVVVTTDPFHRLMTEEIFGPLLTVYLYDDEALDETLTLVDQTSPYGLTGSVFAKDRGTIDMMVRRLRDAAGNLYINDKPTGAVVGQQPFGGARASGTNDKAGSPANLARWVSLGVVKETFAPPTSYDLSNA